MLSIGDRAPDFKINDDKGNPIALSDFKGKKVVLYFYPKDNTPGCTTEACGLRDVYDEILDLGAVVLGVSKDSESSHTKFKEKFNLPFHLLADVDNEIIEPYGAWGEKKMYGKTYMGINRITYIIDENGKITHVWPKVKPADHAAEVLEALKV
ncbi:MAG: thioredoxin-dependent thiol peroxidase [Eubacteriales bacterium]